MYGIIGSAAGHSAPARGRMHCVIIAAEHPGQSAASSARVNQVGPVADRPVVANRAHGRNRRAARGLDRRHAGQHVLAVNDVDALPRDHVGKNTGERRIQPLVLEVVADVRDRRRGRAELQHPQTRRTTVSRTPPGVPGRGWTIVTACPARTQAARELVRAPAAAAADRRKRVGGEEDLQVLRTTGPGAGRRPALLSGR